VILFLKERKMVMIFKSHDSYIYPINSWLQTKMEYRNYYLSFLVALCLSCPYTSLLAQNPPYKAVNLGNWLLVEGWMEQPSLFDGIVNKDLLVLLP
jgi:hypothetical protein